MTKPAVLFLCTGNSARSQMAEALLRHHAGDQLEVHSAGTEPQGVNPLAVQAMDEIGIDIRAQRSKGVEEFLGRLAVRYLIVVCDTADRSCPRVWPGVLNRLFWPFEDPAASRGTQHERLRKFREVRDQIDARIRSWLDELVERQELSPAQNAD